MALRASHVSRSGAPAVSQARISSRIQTTLPPMRMGFGSRPRASRVRTVRTPQESIGASDFASTTRGRMGRTSTTWHHLGFGGRRYFISECDPDSERFEPSASDAFQQTIFATSGRKQCGQQVQRAIAEWDGRRMGFHDDGSHGVGVQLRPSPMCKPSRDFRRIWGISSRNAINFRHDGS